VQQDEVSITKSSLKSSTKRAAQAEVAVKVETLPPVAGTKKVKKEKVPKPEKVVKPKVAVVKQEKVVKTEKAMKQEKMTDFAPEKKKRDRFHGLSEDEVLLRLLPDHLAPDLDIIIVSLLLLVLIRY